MKNGYHRLDIQRSSRKTSKNNWTEGFQLFWSQKEKIGENAYSKNNPEKGVCAGKRKTIDTEKPNGESTDKQYMIHDDSQYENTIGIQ